MTSKRFWNTHRRLSSVTMIQNFKAFPIDCETTSMWWTLFALRIAGAKRISTLVFVGNQPGAQDSHRTLKTQISESICRFSDWLKKKDEGSCRSGALEIPRGMH